MRAVGGFFVGVVLAYLFDPQSGKGRRHKLRDRLLGQLRRSRRRVAGKAKYVAGHVEGMAAEAVSSVTEREDEATSETVRDRILSQAFREAGVSTSDVAVEVADGVVTLRGTIDSTDLAQALIERVRAVPGVQTVTPRLTLRGVAGGDPQPS